MVAVHYTTAHKITLVTMTVTISISISITITINSLVIINMYTYDYFFWALGQTGRVADKLLYISKITIPAT